MNGAIYHITTLHDRRFLLGSTQNPKVRERQHFNALRRHDHANYRLQDAFDAFGESDLFFGVLEPIPDGISRLAREQAWLNAFWSSGCLLNLWKTVAPIHIVRFRERPRETQERIREKCRRSKLGENNPVKRAEVRARISESMKKVWANRKQGTK